MIITFQELRNIKHSLPTGSVKRIAKELKIEEQTVRNYFGAKKQVLGTVTDWHKQTGPGGGVLRIEDLTILNLAKQILKEKETLKKKKVKAVAAKG